MPVNKPSDFLSPREITLLCLIMLMALAVRYLMFIGYQGFDDRTYVSYAWLFANGGDIAASKLVDPWIGRAGAWLPMALSIKAFGTKEWVLCLYSLLVSIATFPVLYILGRHLFGARTAVCATLLLALLPLDVFYATRAFSDAAVGFWSFAAFTAFVLAIDGDKRSTAFVAGLTFGIAYLTKETAVLLAIPIALVLFQRRVWPRHVFGWMAMGLLLAVCAELAFWSLATDDPLYRWHATLASRSEFVPPPKPVVTFWDRIPGPPPHEIFRSDNSLVEAILMFATNEEWGLLYYFVFPLAALALWRGGKGHRTLAIFIFSIVLLLLFFPLHFPNYTLNRDPRYYTMLSGAALLLFSDWALKLRASTRNATFLVLLVTWIPCLYVGYVSSDMGMEKAFARWLKQHSQEIIWMTAFDASNAIVLSEFDRKLNVGIVRVRNNKLVDEAHQVLPSPLVAMRPDLPIAPNIAALSGSLVAVPSKTAVPENWMLETTVVAPPNAMAERVRNILSTIKFPPKYLAKIAPSQGKSMNIYRAAQQ